MPVSPWEPWPTAHKGFNGLNDTAIHSLDDHRLGDVRHAFPTLTMIQV